MVHGLEFGCEAAADQLGGRIGRAQIRMPFLEGVQFAEQLVELAVGDDRRIEHVVAELVVAYDLGQLLPALPILALAGTTSTSG